MKYSVVVPVFNVEKFIKKCIDSILTQEFADFELILVNDGSLDGCPQICDKYAGIDDRVHVIHKENGGLVSARQAGTIAARGEYIICVDGDDWVNPDYLSSVDEIVRMYSPEMISFAYIQNNKIIENGMADKFYDIEELKGMDRCKMYFEFCIVSSLCAKVIKRELYVRHQMQVCPQICMGEDWVCSLGCFLDTSSLYISKKAFYHYRNNPHSITHTFRVSDLDGLLIRFAYVEREYLKYHPTAREQFNLARISQLSAFIVNALSTQGFTKTREIMKCAAAEELLLTVHSEPAKTENLRLSFKIFCIKHHLWLLLYVFYRGWKAFRKLLYGNR